MFQGKAASFVGKLFPVNAFAASSVAIGEVSALTHEIGNDSVESRPFVMQRLLGAALAHTAGARA